ncbi:MAG TPA: hypothetical protein VFX53_05020 [Pedococcus sp.]|nr:hypothetical protein [Pedococcus sp.]
MPRFEKRKDETVVTRKVANMIKDNADRARKNGTANDRIIAKAADELLDRLTIIDEN